MELPLDQGILRIRIGYFAEGGHLVGRGGVLEIPRHPNFRLFAAQNPCAEGYEGKRHAHPTELLSRFDSVVWEASEPPELEAIVRHQLRGNCPAAEKLVSLYSRLRREPWEGPFPLSLRDLQKVCRLTSSGAEADVVSAALVLLPAMFCEPQDRCKAEQLIQHEGGICLPQPGQRHTPLARRLTPGFVLLKVDDPPEAVLRAELRAGGSRRTFVISAQVESFWAKLRNLRQCGQPVLIVGPPGVGKSEAFLAFWEVCRTPLCSSLFKVMVKLVRICVSFLLFVEDYLFLLSA